MATEKRLQADRLYLGDNGRAFCGTLRCAGMTAYYSGRDLSGQRAVAINAEEAIGNNIRCEGCGMQPTLIIIPRA